MSSLTLLNWLSSLLTLNVFHIVLEFTIVDFEQANASGIEFILTLCGFSNRDYCRFPVLETSSKSKTQQLACKKNPRKFTVILLSLLLTINRFHAIFSNAFNYDFA